MPLTVTLYRSIAFKKFKSLMLHKLKAGEPVELDKLSTIFCKRVDRELLDGQYFNILVKQYH